MSQQWYSITHLGKDIFYILKYVYIYINSWLIWGLTGKISPEDPQISIVIYRGKSEKSHLSCLLLSVFGCHAKNL